VSAIVDASAAGPPGPVGTGLDTAESVVAVAAVAAVDKAERCTAIMPAGTTALDEVVIMFDVPVSKPDASAKSFAGVLSANTASDAPDVTDDDAAARCTIAPAASCAAACDSERVAIFDSFPNDVVRVSGVISTSGEAGRTEELTATRLTANGVGAVASVRANAKPAVPETDRCNESIEAAAIGCAKASGIDTPDGADPVDVA
jgi:hypothetical protein